jgi:hypothetical protein
MTTAIKLAYNALNYFKNKHYQKLTRQEYDIIVQTLKILERLYNA